jgi:hypothetical protein
MNKLLVLLITISLFGCAVDPNAGSGATSSVTPEQKAEEVPDKKLKVTVYNHSGEVLHVYHDVIDINTYSQCIAVDVGNKRFYFQSDCWVMSYEEDAK